LLFGEFQVLVKNIAFHYFEVGQIKLKQPLAAGCLRTCAQVRQAPCRRTAPPRPSRAWGRPSRVSPRSHDRDTRQHLADAESRPCRVPAHPRATADGSCAPNHLALPWSKTPPRRPLPAPLPRPRRFAGAVPKITSSQAVVPCLVDAAAVQCRTAALSLLWPALQLLSSSPRAPPRLPGPRHAAARLPGQAIVGQRWAQRAPRPRGAAGQRRRGFRSGQGEPPP
jgi:hypothetical protein